MAESALDYEIAQEQAAALGQLGRALEAAITALSSHDNACAERSERLMAPASSGDPIGEQLVQDASNALWCFIIQRAACGLHDQRLIIREYGVPAKVQNRMGHFRWKQALTFGLNGLDDFLSRSHLPQVFLHCSHGIVIGVPIGAAPKTMMRTLPLIDELETAVTSGTDSRRIEMLTRITDLFVGGAARYSEEQIGVFDDVMVRLVSAIETKARVKLAHRLAPIANAPSSVIHMLAFDDDIDVAQPILKQSDRLEDPALIASANTKSQQHLFAISQRRSLSEAVTDVLVERGDREVVYSVVKNVGARFSDAGFRILVKRSAGDDDLATTVGTRGDIPRPHFLVLLEKASSEVRARLAAEKPQASTAIEGVVAEVVGGIRDDTRNSSPDFAAAQAAVERQNRVRRIGEAEIYQYARDRKFEETAIALSLLCDTPIDVVERALLDPGAEIVLILAKVAGLSAATTKAILLLRAADRGMSAKDLDQALTSFNRLQPDTARRVLGFFRTRTKKPAQPMAPRAVAVNG